MNDSVSVDHGQLAALRMFPIGQMSECQASLQHARDRGPAALRGLLNLLIDVLRKDEVQPLCSWFPSTGLALVGDFFVFVVTVTMILLSVIVMARVRPVGVVAGSVDLFVVVFAVVVIVLALYWMLPVASRFLLAAGLRSGH